MSGPITAMIPVPRVLSLGGRTVVVSECRLRDLAELQSVLDAARPDPLDAVRDGLDGLDDDARELAVARALLRAEEGPPVYGEPAGTAFFATGEGLALWLWMVLRRDNDLTPEDAAALAVAMTPAEYAAVHRAFHGGSSRRALERLLYGDGPAGGGRVLTWSEAITDVVMSTGLPPREVYGLTLSEWRALRTGGKPQGGVSSQGMSRERMRRLEALRERVLREG